MNNIEESIKRAKNPGSMFCPECNEELFSPMDKLSVCLYGKCSLHLDEDSKEEKNLFKIVELI